MAFVNRVLSGAGRYKTMTPESQPIIDALKRARADGATIDHRWASIYVGDDHRVRGIIIDQW